MLGFQVLSKACSAFTTVMQSKLSEELDGRHLAICFVHYCTFN